MPFVLLARSSIDMPPPSPRPPVCTGDRTATTPHRFSSHHCHWPPLTVSTAKPCLPSVICGCLTSPSAHQAAGFFPDRCRPLSDLAITGTPPPKTASTASSMPDHLGEPLYSSPYRTPPPSCIHVHIRLSRLYKIAHICFLPILIIMI
jgi:hypothetical protein